MSLSNGPTVLKRGEDDCERRLVWARLVGGPSDGEWAQVISLGTSCRHRITNKPPYFWARYVRTAQGIYTYDEKAEIIGLDQMMKLIEEVGKDNVAGSYGT